MPTTRMRRKRGRIEDVSETARWIASDYLFPEPEEIDPFEKWELSFPTTAESRAACQQVWCAVKDEVLDAYVVMRPGRRPAWWWCFSAPRASDAALREMRIEESDFLWRPENRPSEPRRRISGVGDPKFAALAYVPSFHLGIPDLWITPAEVAYHSGNARDVHGGPIGTEFAGKQFKGEAVDPLSPPRFESQAAYLRRHGLLLRGEARLLASFDFAPELVAPSPEVVYAD